MSEATPHVTHVTNVTATGLPIPAPVPREAVKTMRIEGREVDYLPFVALARLGAVAGVVYSPTRWDVERDAAGRGTQWIAHRTITVAMADGSERTATSAGFGWCLFGDDGRFAAVSRNGRTSVYGDGQWASVKAETRATGRALRLLLGVDLYTDDELDGLRDESPARETPSSTPSKNAKKPEKSAKKGPGPDERIVSLMEFYLEELSALGDAKPKMTAREHFLAYLTTAYPELAMDTQKPLAPQLPPEVADAIIADAAVAAGDGRAGIPWRPAQQPYGFPVEESAE